MKHPKLSAIGLVASCALLVAACGGNLPTASTRALRTSGGGPVSVSMFAGAPPTVANMKTDWATRYVERRFGLNIHWNLVPLADVPTKQPLLLASGQYPDVIWDGSLSQENVLQYSSEGILRPLNSLIKKYAPNVERALKTTPGFKAQATAPNGKIYALPNFNYCTQCTWPYTFWINLKFLNQYHLNLPRTTAQFAHVLSVFRQHGITPLTSAPGWGSNPVVTLMNAFIPFNGGYLDVRHGKVVFVATQPQWKQGLEYLYSLYKSGDFSKVVFTQETTAMQKLISEQKAGVFTAGGAQNTIPNYGEPGSGSQDWFPLPPLKGPKGVHSVAFAEQVGGLTFAITNHATKQQEIRVMKLLNYLYSPVGTQTMQFGPRGKYWTSGTPGVKAQDGKQAVFKTNWSAIFAAGSTTQNEAWGQWGPYYLSQQWRNSQQLGSAFASSSLETMSVLSPEIAGAGYQPLEEYPSGAWVPSSEGEQYAAEATNINNYVSQWTEEFVTGEKSIAANWAGYVHGLQKLDLSQYLKTSKQHMGHPFMTSGSEFQRSTSQVKYLLSLGPLPALWRKYLPQAGIPAQALPKK